MTYNSLVYDENQVINFYNTFFSETNPFYTDFFCIAARRKYMAEEEKATINLGNTCMVSKTILKEYNVDKFLSKLYQADASASFFLDRDGNYIPRSCMVFYMNLGRSNVLKVVKDFKDFLADLDYSASSAMFFNNKEKTENVSNQFKTIQNNLLKSFQDPKNSESSWFDIDCDVGNSIDESLILKYKDSVQNYLDAEQVFVIQTHGGCHILFSKSALSNYNKNLSARIDSANLAKGTIKKLVRTVESTITHIKKQLAYDFGAEVIKEVTLNQNLAVPIPGTLQGGFPVKLF